MNRDYLPTASVEHLRHRAEIIGKVRHFFEERGFFHVETPILSHDIVIDRYLQPVWVEKERVTANQDAANKILYLQTSPEFSMKRLLVAGAEAIYQIGKVFRAGESGTRHNPEFTMLEWYRVGDDLAAGIQLLGEFATRILRRDSFRSISYEQLFLSRLNVNPHSDSVPELARAAERLGLELTGFSQVDSERDEWLNLLMSQLERELGFDAPTIVYDWPATQSALAKVRTEENVAERFELFVDGVELANGYHELLDPQELSRRNETNNRLRESDGQPLLPENSRLLDAMRAGMPPCAGVAVGIDRLIMVALGLESIDQTIAFPIDRA